MALSNKRLLTAAELLGQVDSVADIGTDHAFLPIHLIKAGIAKKVIACDIAKGPLAVAQSNVTKYKVGEKIELRLANGLLGLKPKEVDAITILGMGGETIADILAASPWVKSPDITLILQPMSCDDRLRDYLYKEGFEILTEVGVESQNRFYTVMKVVYSGNLPKVECEYKYIGKLLENPNDAAITFVKNRINSMKNCMSDIEKVERKQDLYNELKNALKIIESNPLL